MIVKITNESKKWMTVYELEQAKIIIQQFKEDDSMADLCQIAAKVASRTIYEFEIFKSSAEIAGNSRIRDAYHDDSGKLDVWIECYAYNSYIGFFTIGAYYTDLLKYDGTKLAAIACFCPPAIASRTLGEGGSSGEKSRYMP